MKEADARIQRHQMNTEKKGMSKKILKTSEKPTVLADSLFKQKPWNKPTIPQEEIEKQIAGKYDGDKLFEAIMKEPENYRTFQVRDNMVFTRNLRGDEVACIPNSNRELVTKILQQSHEIVGHFGEQKTSEYIRRYYWWPKLMKDT